MSTTDRYSQAMLRELLRGEQALRRQAEELRTASRKALVELGYAIAPELLDGLAKESPTQIEATSTSDLAKMIQRDVKDRLRRLRTQVRRLQHQHDQTQSTRTELKKLREKVKHLQTELKKVNPTCDYDTDQRPSYQACQSDTPRGQAAQSFSESPSLAEDLALSDDHPSPDRSQQVPSLHEDFQPYAEPALWPEWFRAWVEPGLNDARRRVSFLTARKIVQVLGQTGEPLRSVVLERSAPQAGHAVAGGAESRAMGRLVKLGWVAREEARRGHIHPHLVYLTERGRHAYRLLYGQPPAEQETLRLLKMHGSPEHTYLILETQQLLDRAGFYVERYFDPLPVSAGEYVPDLIATYEGTTAYIEAERATHKEPQERKKKWQKALEAGGGRLHIALGTEREVDPLLSEVTYIAGKTGHAVDIRALVTEPLVKGNAIPKGWEIFSIQKNVG